MEHITFSIIVLIFSAVAHEMAHAYAADYLGDSTPRLQGRLSLNPLRHLDPVGSFFLPAITLMIGGFIFGWAKPVEFNPYNLKHPKRDEMIISIAGPLSNACIAIVFGLLIRCGADLGLSDSMLMLATIVVIINLSLMIFNLLPIPPLDGSKILLNLIPDRYMQFKNFIVQNGLIFLVLFIIFGTQLLYPLITGMFAFLTGISY